MDKEEERRVLEENLNKALDEAWTKANNALKGAVKGSEGYKRLIWAAEESAEYTSLLFSLTYDLEDFDPPPSKSKAAGIVSRVKESVEALREVRESSRKQTVKDYTNLRRAVHGLRIAHHDSERPGKRRQSLTRS